MGDILRHRIAYIYKGGNMRKRLKNGDFVCICDEAGNEIIGEVVKYDSAPKFLRIEIPSYSISHGHYRSFHRIARRKITILSKGEVLGKVAALWEDWRPSFAPE